MVFCLSVEGAGVWRNLSHWHSAARGRSVLGRKRDASVSHDLHSRSLSIEYRISEDPGDSHRKVEHAMEKISPITYVGRACSVSCMQNTDCSGMAIVCLLHAADAHLRCRTASAFSQRRGERRGTTTKVRLNVEIP